MPFLALLLLVSGSAHAGATDWRAYWEEIPSAQVPALTPEGDLAAFQLSVERQLENCREFAAGQFRHCAGEADPTGMECDVPTLEKLLELAKAEPDWKGFQAKAKNAFRWFRHKDATGTEVQFTGYNTPFFEGATAPDAKHRYPVYARPADLVSLPGPGGATVWKKRQPDGTLVPYDERKTIDVDRALAGKGLEVAWMEFPSDLLRLHIEGAGVLEVREKGGRVKQYGIGFAGKNGLPFVSVFKYLREKGVDAKYLSFPGLKQYFVDFPDDMWPTLVTNPSYTFFKIGEEPPCGSARVHLTGGHSIAVDTTRLPLGVAAFFQAQRPVPKEGGGTQQLPFSRFGFAQDTGSGIQGAHVDVYWGTDDYAQFASDRMNGKGTLYYVKLKDRR